MKHLIDAVEKHTERILAAERYVWEHPETGYKEYKTSAYMEKAFRELGYELVMAEGITGFYTVLDTGRPGPEVLVLGELDSIICPDHPESDPETGAVHSCGHNAQCAALIGLAAALKEPGVLDGLCGRIRLCAVPAEELLEIEYRNGLKKEGKIRYLGGKTEGSTLPLWSIPPRGAFRHAVAPWAVLPSRSPTRALPPTQGEPPGAVAMHSTPPTAV